MDRSDRSILSLVPSELDRFHQCGCALLPASSVRVEVRPIRDEALLRLSVELYDLLAILLCEEVSSASVLLVRPCLPPSKIRLPGYELEWALRVETAGRLDGPAMQ